VAAAAHFFFGKTPGLNPPPPPPPTPVGIEDFGLLPGSRIFCFLMRRDHTYDSFIPTGVGGGIENGYTAPEGSAGKGNGPEGVHTPHRERNDGGACF